MFAIVSWRAGGVSPRRCWRATSPFTPGANAPDSPVHLAQNQIYRSNLHSYPQTRRSAMKTAIIIPARYASSRLPAKPLLRETGKYLIQHVYERACESKADAVIVATDDIRIFQAVQGFGGNVVMTRGD